MKRRLARTIISSCIALAFVGTANAALERMGPINNAPSVGGYPSWFQDKTGLALEFCDLTTQAELTGGWCTLIPPAPTYPETFPSPFYIEHFYWNGSAVATAGTTKAKLVTAVEAAFANGTRVVPGDQVTFGRIRVDITPAPYSGTYTVYHPFGKWIFTNVVAGDRIRSTQDIGLACVGTFSCTLNTDIGPFLLPSANSGGAEVPPVPDLVYGQDPYYDLLVNTGTTTPSAGTGKKYIADPARIGPVTGSRLPPFVGNDGITYDHNVFRVEGPNGFVIHQPNFNLNGRVMTGTLPGQVTPDRASYSQAVAASPTGKKLDVFATGLPSSQGRLPAQPTPTATTTPLLSFFDQPCVGTLDPATDRLMPPYSAPTGANQIQMGSAGTKYWGQAQPTAIPLQVCLEDATARDATGAIVPYFYLVTVTDEVAITKSTTSGAFYDPANGGSLTVSATSSDTLAPPVLSLAGYGEMVNGSITVAPLSAPPAKVTVISSEGGTSDLIVTTAVGTATAVIAPSAINDTVTMFEDCSPAPATSCATPLVISPLANDTYNGGPIPAGATLRITQPPRLGTAVLNADNTITYTPNPNVNGADGLAYTVTVNGGTSNAASVTINITPVNDIPIAVNDTAGGRVGLLNSFNVIQNDLDPDGATDLANAQIVTWPPQLGTQPVPTNGVVNFTPTSTGTYTFTYQAVDKAGAVSANTATVTVTVAPGEAILVAKSLYRASNTGGVKSARWTVQGTDSIIQGQTLTVAYRDGVLAAAAGGGNCDGTATNPKCVVGKAVVDSLGNYLYDVVGTPGGPWDPTDSAAWATKPTTVNVFSSSPVLGGSKTSIITFK